MGKTHARKCVRKQWHPQLHRQTLHGIRKPRATTARPAHNHRPLGAVQRLGDSAHLLSPRRLRAAGNPKLRLVRTLDAATSWIVGYVTVNHSRLQRFTKWKIQVHRASRCAHRKRHRTISHAAQVAQHQVRWIGLRQCHFLKPAHLVTVQLHLVNSLVGAGRTRLRRPVRRQHQHRHARMIAFHNRWQEVGSGRTTGAQQRSSPPAVQANAQRKESRAAFVQQRVHGNLAVSGERKCKRRGTRARRNHRCAQPGPRQLIHKYGRPQHVAVR